MKRLPTVIVILTLAFAGCGGTSEATSTSSTTTTSTTVATTTTAAAPGTTGATTTTNQVETTTTTSTTTSSTTTTVPVSLCPAPQPLPEGTLTFAGIPGDFDGDGNQDELLTYQAAPNDWRMRVVFADGGGADAAITHADDLFPPRPIGGFDIDGDGTEEAFVTVGAGASTMLIGLYDISDCVATRITAGGMAAVFSVGASVGAESGVVCPGDGSVRRTFAQRVDDGVFEGGFEDYTLNGAALVSQGIQSQQMSAEQAGVLAGFDCGGLILP